MIREMRIKYVCWPQHTAFIVGVLFYSIASITSPNLPEATAAKAPAAAPFASGTTKLEPPAVPAPATPTTEKR
jgi:hypothetical protein